MSLCAKLVRLAHARDDLRPHLLPLLRMAASEKDLLAPVYDLAARLAQVPGVRSANVDDWATSSHTPTFIAADVTVYVYVDPKLGGRATNTLKGLVRRLEKEFNQKWEKESAKTGRLNHISSIEFWSPRGDQGGPDALPTRSNPREMGWEPGPGRDDELRRRREEFYRRNPYTLTVSFYSDLVRPASTSIWDDDAWESSGGRSVGPYAQRAAASSYRGDPYWMNARYPGVADDGTPVRRGDRVLYWPRTKTIMVGEKAEAAWRKFQSEVEDEDFYNSRYASTGKVALSQVATVILQQMGGVRRLAAMLGIGSGPAYQFYDLPGGQGVGFVWPNKQRSKGNCVEVKLVNDTYTVSFFNWAGADKKKVKEYDDIYADQLVGIFEDQTGWRIRL